VEVPVLQAIVLGLVQGLTEFLPVSSSGHLVVVPYLLGWPAPPLSFDVALHFGTLIAVVAYFWADLWYLASRSVGVGVVDEAESGRARRTLGLLALGSVPAAIAGYFGQEFFAEIFKQPRLVAVFLVCTGGILWGAETVRRRRARALAPEALERDPALDLGRGEETTGWVDTLAIGSAQALAIFPGISRSGATIAAGMVRGMSRGGAARFSFLLSVPIIFGATLVSVRDLLSGEGSEQAMFTNLEVAVGVGVAAASGYWAIRFLLKLVATDDLTGFARYVVFFGVLTFLGTLWIGNPSQV
jgi:undecaprenyl-diphosphatase